MLDGYDRGVHAAFLSYNRRADLGLLIFTDDVNGGSKSLRADQNRLTRNFRQGRMDVAVYKHPFFISIPDIWLQCYRQLSI